MIGRCVISAARIVCITLLASSAFAQTAVRQTGPVTANKPAMWAGDHNMRQGAGAAGDVAGKMITGGFSVVGSICDYTNTTNAASYDTLCLDSSTGGLTRNGTSYPLSALGGGNVVGPGSSTQNAFALYNSTDGQLIKDSGWIDDGLRLTAPSGRTITLSNSGAFQLGGNGGPYMTAVAGISDTVTIIAQPGAGPSGDTTNLEVFPPDTGDKAYLSVSRSLPVGSEERLIFGHEGGSSDYTIGQVVSGGGASCHNINFLDGVSAVPGFTIVCGTAGAPPNPQIGTGATLMAGTAASGSQALLRVDGTLALEVGEGAGLTSIIFNKHISSLGTSPSLSSCGTTPSIVSASDTKGFITIGTGGPTSCTVTFATAYAAAPVVVLTGLGSGAIVWSAATVAASNFVISGDGADLSGLTVMYMVMQ